MTDGRQTGVGAGGRGDPPSTPVTDQRTAREQRRILDEYRRRARDVSGELYAPWNPAAAFVQATRVRTAAKMLHRVRVFPVAGDPVCEIGYGTLGWLADLLGWGLRVKDLHGIELDERRAAVARRAFPGSDLRIGDASGMPWPDGSFKLIVASTLFTSILDAGMRQAVASEAARCLRPGGALLWYDFAWNNPRNRHVRGIHRRELLGLFGSLSGDVQSVTLAPPVARAIVPRSHALGSLLEAIPLLRTHLLGVLLKPRESR